MKHAPLQMRCPWCRRMFETRDGCAAHIARKHRRAGLTEQQRVEFAMALYHERKMREARSVACGA
jgi:hypothetical protein